MAVGHSSKAPSGGKQHWPTVSQSVNVCHLKDNGPGDKASVVLFATVPTTPYCFSNTEAKGRQLFDITFTSC